jgi:uncharacterized repeat protein (TIGR01451 family)
MQEADLSVEDITALAACSGQPVEYKVTVKNSGPNDVSGAKFVFSFPANISGIVVSSVATIGVSTTSGGAVTANAYT